MEQFKEFGLSEDLLNVIKKLGFEKPSEIQAKTIPPILKGKDVIGYSATGSGKTFAFGSGIVEKIHPGKGVQALILTPTRELAEQVADQINLFSNRKFKIQKVYGGVAIEPQIRGLRNAEIVVGTPGRLLDHLRKETLDVSKLTHLVLDEADRLVDMGFLPDVETIIKECPKKRQTLLFSATSSLDIDYIMDKYMTTPIEIEVVKFVDPSKLHQSYYDVPSSMKFSLLVHLLKKDKSKLVMVFCNTKSNTDIVASNLKRFDIEAVAIHGGITQNKRTSIMKKFHDEHIQVLVCTDVAARGLDIKNVSHIYNYDSSKSSKDYIHRIGRTARAGKEGQAISLVSQRDYENFRNVKDNSSLDIPLKDLPLDIPKVSFHYKSYGEDRGRGFGGRSGGRFGGSSRGRFGGRPGGSSRGRFGGRPSGGSRFGSDDNYSRDGPRRSFGGRPSSGGRFNRDRSDRPSSSRFGGASRRFGGRPSSGAGRYSRDRSDRPSSAGRFKRDDRNARDKTRSSSSRDRPYNREGQSSEGKRHFNPRRGSSRPHRRSSSDGPRKRSYSRENSRS